MNFVLKFQIRLGLLLLTFLNKVELHESTLPSRASPFVSAETVNGTDDRTSVHIDANTTESAKMRTYYVMRAFQTSR